MKSLKQFILESSQNKVRILKCNAANAQNAADIEDTLSSMLNTMKPFSIGREGSSNSPSGTKFFNAFVNKLAAKFGSADAARQMLRKFGIGTLDALRELLRENQDKMRDGGWAIETIKEFNLTELQKQYREWKNSDDYVEGKPVDDEDFGNRSFDTDEVRTIVIYNGEDPADDSYAREYEFRGKLGKQNSHQLNMRKMDWAYNMGGAKYYFKARPILATTYYKRKAEGRLDAIKDDRTFEQSIDAE